MLIDTPWLPPLLFAVFFATLWIVVCSGISHQIGWPRLAQHYRATAPFDGVRVPIRHARFGRSLLGGVNNALNIGVNARGIEIRMVFLFRVNCPTLFVPWSEIRIARGKSWFMQYTEFEFAAVPGASMQIFGKAARRLQDAAGAAWPEVAIKPALN